MNRFTYRRAKLMIEQRVSLIEARRESAARAKLQKEQITRVMDEVRSNPAKADKVVRLIQSGKVSLESIMGMNGIMGGTGNSPKKSKSKGSKSTSELLAMDRASLSAGMSGNYALLFDSGYPLAKSDDPKAYVSPYELNAAADDKTATI
jgi:hypothetical protein